MEKFHTSRISSSHSSESDRGMRKGYQSAKVEKRKSFDKTSKKKKKSSRNTRRRSAKSEHNPAAIQKIRDTIALQPYFPYTRIRLNKGDQPWEMDSSDEDSDKIEVVPLIFSHVLISQFVI